MVYIMIRKSFLIIWFFFFYGSNLYAQTLTESVNNALNSDHILKGEYHNYQYAEINTGISISAFLPTVTLSTSTMLVHEGVVVPSSANSWGLNLQQVIYQGTLFNSGLRAQRSMEEYSKVQYRERLFNVVLNAIKAHFNYIQAQKILNVYEKNIKFMETQLDITKARGKVGETTKADLLSAKAQLAQAVSDKTQAYGDYINAKTEYIRITGQAPEKLVTSDHDIPQVPRSIANILEEAMENNLTVQKSYLNQKVSYYNKQSALSAMSPTVVLFGSTQFGSYNSMPTEFGLSLNYPIYAGGTNVSNFRAQGALYQRAVEQHKDALKQTESNLVSLWNQYNTAVASEKAARSLLQTRKEEVEIIKKEYDLKLKTTYDVLDAQLDLMDAEILFIQRKDYRLVTLFTLILEMGVIENIPFSNIIDQYMI